MGSAVHLALSKHALGLVPDLSSIAKQYGVDPDELERLFAYGCIAWKDLAKHFPNARTEEVLEGSGIRGHADVFGRDETVMTVLDWKSNRVKRDYRAQVVGYGAAAVDQFGMPESGEVKVVTVWLRFFEFEVITVTQDDVERLYHDIERAKLEIGKRYAPGDPCGYCRRQLVCNARHEFLASATSALMPVASGVELTPEMLGKLYHKSKMVAKALKAYDAALRMQLRQGALSDGEGSLIELVQSKKDKVMPREAWPLLVQNGFSEDELAKCVTMSKTKVMEVVSAKSVRGQKGKAKAALLETMRGAGAVQETFHERIHVKKDCKQGDDDDL
jgi:hypothetical protein